MHARIMATGGHCWVASGPLLGEHCWVHSSTFLSNWDTRGHCGYSWSSPGGVSWRGDSWRRAPFLSCAFLSQQSWWFWGIWAPWAGGWAGGQGSGQTQVKGSAGRVWQLSLLTSAPRIQSLAAPSPLSFLLLQGSQGQAGGPGQRKPLLPTKMGGCPQALLLRTPPVFAGPSCSTPLHPVSAGTRTEGLLGASLVCYWGRLLRAHKMNLEPLSLHCPPTHHAMI